MYATLEDRKTHSLLAFNALKVHDAIHNNGDAHRWAAMFILSSAVTTVDYLAGTLWRLPVSIITIPLSIIGVETKLPTIKDLFLCAAKTFFCAIGILIFPVVGICDPERSLALAEYLGLVTLPVVHSNVLRSTVANQRKHHLDADLSVSGLLLKKHTIDVIPDDYKNKNLVHKRDENWDKISKLTTTDININISYRDNPQEVIEVPLFPKRWNTKRDKALPFVLQRGKINGIPLWQHVADLIDIEKNDRDHVEVMKEIIATIYRLSRKEQPAEEIAPKPEPEKSLIVEKKRSSTKIFGISRGQPPRKTSIPKINMDVWDVLCDIKQEDLVFKDPADGKYVPRWQGPVFLATNLAEWEEVELKNCMEKTLYKGEPLLNVVARRLKINMNPVLKSTTNKKLKVIEDIIHTVYPVEK